MIVSAGHVHASECGIGDSDFPFCVGDTDDQGNENKDEVNRESSSSSSSVSDTNRGSDSSTRSISEACCVSNTFEPEEPEIKREGNTITGTICDDVIRGSNEREIITALAGNDEVTGKEADDVIYGNDS